MISLICSNLNINSRTEGDYLCDITVLYIGIYLVYRIEYFTVSVLTFIYLNVAFKWFKLNKKRCSVQYK